MSTIFKKIIDKEIKSDIVYENDSVIAFNDIAPVAPIHVLIIPKIEIKTLNDIDRDNVHIIGELFLVAKKLAKELNIDSSGYRTIFNCNKDGCQTVFHIHLHLIGGRKLTWPIG